MPGGPPETTPGGGDGGPGGPPTLNVTLGNVTLGPNATALDHREAAAALLASANADGPGRSGGALVRRLLPLLNGTFDHVLDERRVLSARVFKDDMRVAAPLHRRAPNVTRHLIVSDRKLADQAIEDAETVRAALDERNVSYDEAAVAENISEARRMFEQARSLPAPARHASIQHYREAWTHAQRAIDVMDEAVAPNVTVEDRSDLPHNGSRTVNVTGQVFDVRPYELEGTLEFNGTTRGLELSNQTAPLVNASFNVSVTLERQWPQFVNGSLAPNGVVRVYTVNASVHDPGTDLADQGYDDEEQLDLHGPQAAGGELHFDGDGLPGRYEEDVTGTDPLDPNSDVPATNASEAGDSRVDGTEDPDDDLLGNFREFLLGTEPLDPDTDGDGLTDGFEATWELAPLTVDGDDDGIPDGLEDADDDGLANLGEQRAGTVPTSNDTDRDGLSDGREVDELGTDPNARDTDDDGLADPDELALDTAPTAPDTDSDGVLDGNETFTTVAEGEETGAVVELTGEGNVAAGVTVSNVTGENTTDLGVGPAVFVDNETAFDNATVHIPVGSSVDLDSEASNLTLVKLEEGSGAGWEEVNATLDRANRTMVATVTSFSAFMVVDEERFEELTHITIPAGWPHLKTTFENAADWSGDDVTAEFGDLVVTSERSGGPDDTDEVECRRVVSGGDCDGDGISNEEERRSATELDDPDSDEDGVNDGVDECPVEAGDGPNGCPTGGDGTTDSDGDGVPDSEDGCPDIAGDGSDGCPTDLADADGDGVSDSDDECPFTPGDGPEGCPTDGDGTTDSDGDGVPDSEDGCPDIAGDGSDGCPTDLADADGDGVSDSDDECPFTPGDGDDGCPNSNTSSTADAGTTDLDTATGDGPQTIATRSVDLGPTNEKASIVVRLETVVDSNSAVTVEVVGPRERTVTLDTITEITSSPEKVTGDLSGLTSGMATVRVIAEGEATAVVHRIEVREDSDGDGIRDVVERATQNRDLHLSFLRVEEGRNGGETVVVDEPVRLDLDATDTDKDTLRDGEEVTLNVDREDGSLKISTETTFSLPSQHFSDADLLDDGDEQEPGTNPLDPDTDGDGFLDGKDELPLTPNDGWTVNIWHSPGILPSRKQMALDSIQTLSDQVTFEIRAIEMGPSARGLVNCSSSSNTTDNFERWLRTEAKVREGQHHLLLVRCPFLEELTIDGVTFRPGDPFIERPSFNSSKSDNYKIFSSRNRGGLTHAPDQDDSGKDFARSIVNTAIAFYNPDRYRQTVMHEFAHAAMDSSKCPIGQGQRDHLCGGYIDGQISPMYITVWRKDIGVTSKSGHVVIETNLRAKCDGHGLDRIGDVVLPSYTLQITSCTEDALESYHRGN